MKILSGKFNLVLEELVVEKIESCLFYNSRFGLRFDCEKAPFKIMKKIYENLPFDFDILRLDYLGTDKPDINKFKTIFKLGDPDEYDGISAFWNIHHKKFNYKRLLKEICRADFGGYSELISSVYFLDSVKKVIFHPYDDRGADLIAVEPDIIKECYKKLDRFLLDYDREIMDKYFQGEKI